MILKTEHIKSISSKILNAIDTSEHSIVASTLELKSVGKTLYFIVANSTEYYVKIGIELEQEEDFHATVNASMFLKLLSQITTDTVEFTVTDMALCVEGNGRFNIPLMIDFDKMLDIPEINIDIVTQKFNISKDILNSINNYNAREIMGASFSDILHKSFYIDDKGCITYNVCACINNFSLAKPVKVILSSKIVKLFKLFSDDEITFELGFNQIGSTTQTRVKFYDSSVVLTAITMSSDELISRYPVELFRNKVASVYPYSTSIGRNELMQAINRFTVFANYDVNTTECNFNFVDDTLIIEDKSGNSESIKLGTPLNGSYKALLDIERLKTIVESTKDFSLMNISFGDGDTFLFSRGSVHNLLPESIEV